MQQRHPISLTGTDLPVAEQPGEGKGSKDTAHRFSIMMPLPKQLLAAPVAGEQDACHWLCASQLGAQIDQVLMEVDIRHGGVTHLELDGLAGTWHATDHNPLSFQVAAEHPPDHE